MFSRNVSHGSRSGPLRADGQIPDKYDLGHIAGWETFNLRVKPAHTSSVDLYNRNTTQHFVTAS